MSAHITVRLGEPLRRLPQAILLDLHFTADRVSVAEVLARLEADTPGFAAALTGEVYGHPAPYQIFANTRRVPSGEETQFMLANGDRLSIFLPAIGGEIPQPLPATFYAHPTLETARALLGCTLVRTVEGQRLAGRITEVEAYIGDEDQASHAARGRTARNWPMFAAGGLSYVYLIYGMYHCFNVATEAEGFPAAVLIRAIEPLEGTAQMQAARGRTTTRGLTDGPGKLCRALQIDRAFNGHDLTAGRELWIEPGEPPAVDTVCATPRINVGGDDHARTAPWRLVAKKA